MTTSSLGFDNATGPLPRPEARSVALPTQFSAALAQYATPLFSPWPIVETNIRANPAMSTVTLSAHPASSSRREGRHARG